MGLYRVIWVHYSVSDVSDVSVFGVHRCIGVSYCDIACLLSLMSIASVCLVCRRVCCVVVSGLSPCLVCRCIWYVKVSGVLVYLVCWCAWCVAVSGVLVYLVCWCIWCVGVSGVLVSNLMSQCVRCVESNVTLQQGRCHDNNISRK